MSGPFPELGGNLHSVVLDLNPKELLCSAQARSISTFLLLISSILQFRAGVDSV